MSMKTEYRGHNITYSENSDEWNCYDIGYSNISMQKVKAKIDAFYLKLRKASAVQCYEISGHGRIQKTESTIIEFVKTVEQKAWSTGKVTRTDHKVAVVARRDGNERASRRETDIQMLMPETEEAHAAFAEAERLYERVVKAQKEFDTAYAAIPRVTLADIEALRNIKEGEADA